MKKLFDTYLLLSKGERNGLNVLIVILLMVIIVRIGMPLWVQKKTDTFEMERKIALIESDRDRLVVQQHLPKGLYGVQDGDTLDDQLRQNLFVKRVNQQDKDHLKPNAEQLFYFDPNDVTKEELALLGVDERIANRIVNYREKGGRFNKAIDIRKIYGLNEQQAEKLLPYIKIKDTEIMKDDQIDELVELNGADTTMLVQLKGIGPVFARRICSYRDRLGGFYCVEQLKEVYHFPEETYNALAGRFCVDRQKVKKMNLNFVTLSELKRHPYVDEQTARTLIAHRSEHGPFDRLDQLKVCGLVDSVEYQRVINYLVVE